MQMGRKHQMQTMDQDLLEIYQRGEITYDVAVSNARSRTSSSSDREKVGH